MNRPRIPCTRNCQKRSPECHATCKKYAEYVEKQKAWSRRVNDEKLLDKEYREQVIRRTLR